jgi:hypothetical protein
MKDRPSDQEDRVSQLPPGARAHIHLGAEGAAVSDEQRSLPRAA